jgi:fatty-acyl-CoA synthase
MTETSPLVSVCRIKSTLAHKTEEELADRRTSVGLAGFPIRFRVVEQDTTNPLPWDGKTRGELQVQGPWVARTYYNDPRAQESFTSDGWLRTGDVASVDPQGFVRITDRAKDLIKSGGEWISSVELENALMAHPSVAECAVIARPDEKWTERPFACVVLAEGCRPCTPEELREHLSSRVAKWWIPDDFAFIEAVPKTSVGKFDKKVLRRQLAEGELAPEFAAEAK